MLPHHVSPFPLPTSGLMGLKGAEASAWLFGFITEEAK